MGLQNLYSDLSTSGYPNHEDTSLKYGAGSPIFDGVFESNTLTFGKGTAFDRPGQEFSNQPFIISNKPNTIRGEYHIDSFTDGLVRGGIVTATERSIRDVERITKFFLTPQGVGFLTKQVGLQLSNPIIRTKAKAVGEEGDNLFDKIGDFISDLEGSKSDQRIYNLGVNTLASVAASAAGIRFKREGTNPLSDPSKFEGYKDDIKTISENAGTDPKTSANRLIQLLGTHIIHDDPGNVLKPINSYQGGPNSVYGIGQTTINQYVSTTFNSQLFGIFDDTIDQEIQEVVNPNEEIEVNIDDVSATDIKNDPNNYEKLKPPRDIGGRTNRKTKHKSIFPYHVNLATNTPKPLGTEDYNSFWGNLNAQSIQLNKNVYDGLQDFIPFRFEAVNTEKPELSDFIVFKAFLDNFNDQFNANHNSFNYNGRGETFYTYNGFTRNIDFSFKIAAQSKDELKPLYQKLNYLLSNTAPEYSSTGRMRTPFMKLTVGDWCNRLPGVLNSIGLSWQKDYPWDLGDKNTFNGITVNNPNSGGLILPHVLDVNVQFTPIHQFMPEKSFISSEDPNKLINTPFINAK